MGLIYPINTQNSQNAKTQQYYLHTCTMVFGLPPHRRPHGTESMMSCEKKKKRRTHNLIQLGLGFSVLVESVVGGSKTVTDNHSSHKTIFNGNMVKANADVLIQWKTHIN